ncbi:MAG: IS200/IS605 family transposase [Pyrinomonadaceae bacterium]
MAQTHLSLHVHLVFHTKDNRASISEEWRTNLHAFLGGCLKTAGCVPEAIGGTNDHVHILAGFRATHSIADIVKDIKVASSKWVHNEIGDRVFGWQGGYGAITVSPTQIPGVKRYISNQMEHHNVKTAKEEYVEMIDAAGIEYDANYLWN